jgi:hypothetical protein
MPTEPIRERSLPYVKSFPAVTNLSGEKQTQGGDSILGVGKQITVSEGHQFNRSKGYFDSGGPFFTSRVDHDFQMAGVSAAVAGNGNFLYSGPVYAPLPTVSELASYGFQKEFGDSNESSMNSDGATAISRCDPYDPPANLATSLIELRRDGLPSLLGARTWKDRALRVKNAGDEYLNYAFGWVPLVNDVKDGAHVVANAGSLAKAAADNEGTNVHRGYAFPTESETVTLDEHSGFAEFPGYYTGFIFAEQPYPVRTVTRTTSRKRWFEGSFTYAMPSKTDSFRRHVSAGDRASELLGLELTPEVLWEATPWSWAVDWFSNAGEVTQNLTAFSNAGQVMRYGYIMEETIDKITVTLSGAGLTSHKPMSGSWEANRFAGPLSSSIIITTKRRGAANPFGFGVSWDGLSSFQASIAAALGISRLS